MSRVGSTHQSSGEDTAGGPLSEGFARAVVETCTMSGVTSKDGAVDLKLSRQDISDKLENNMALEFKETFENQKNAILDAILHSRYANLYSLLRHHVTEETYLGIVRNQILVDVQVRRM